MVDQQFSPSDTPSHETVQIISSSASSSGIAISCDPVLLVLKSTIPLALAKRTDHMDGRLSVVPVIGTTQNFAINGNQPFGTSVDRLHPLEETGLKLLGSQAGHFLAMVS